MTTLKNILFILILFGFFFIAGAVPVLAATYGNSTYGSGVYNVGQVSSGNSGNSGSSSIASAISSFFCTNQAPSSAPNLYEVDTKGTQAILYFAPAGSPYSAYTVSFGNDSKDDGYNAGFSLSQTTGALKYDVFQLKPNSVYTFKVRGNNGCKPGAWSSTLSAKTGAKNSKILARYFPKKQAIAATPQKQGGLKGWVTSKISSFFPKSAPGIGTAGQNKASNTATQSQPNQKQQSPQQAPVKDQPVQQQAQKPQSFWSKVGSFFGL